MERLKLVRFGRVAGRLSKEEISKLYEFCKSRDILNGKENGAYIFDARPGAIHWLDKETRRIYSSLYFDMSTGEVRLQSGTFEETDKEKNWDEKTATEKWNELIEKIMEKLK